MNAAVRLVALTGAFLLAGCDQKPAAAPEPPANSEFGRWVVVPASSDLVAGQGRYQYAWKLDTKTGDLALCTYSPASMTPPVSDSLSCVWEK